VLRKSIDNYVVTIKKDIRKILKIDYSSILLLEINNQKFIRTLNNDYQISIPKKITNTNEIILKFTNIYSKQEAKRRERFEVNKNELNIRSFVPSLTQSQKEIYILPEKDESYVWYSIGGGAKEVKIKNCLNIEKLSELVGFYFGDGSTSNGIKSFRLTNCEPSVLIYCLDILEEIGIKREEIKLQIIYSTPTEISYSILNRCVRFWSKTLNVHKNQIISVSKSKGKTESLKYGSARIFIDKNILVEILLHGLLANVLNRIKNPENEYDYVMLKGFLRGLASAEGCVLFNKNNSLIRVGLSFDPHSEELSLYKTLLGHLGIENYHIHGNELLIQKHKNFQKLNEMNLFKMHDPKRVKFNLGFHNHKFTKKLI